MLFSSLENYENRIPAYQAALSRVPGERKYEFVVPSVQPGNYFLVACFEIGCGDWRDSTTGQLRVIPVRAGDVASVHFRL